MGGLRDPDAPPPTRSQWVTIILCIVVGVAGVQWFVSWRFAEPETPPLPEWYEKLVGGEQ